MFPMGGGIGMLCLAVVGLFMSERRWVRILCVLFLALYGITIIVEVVTGRWDPAMLLVPGLLFFLGVYVQKVQHMFDPKDGN